MPLFHFAKKYLWDCLATGREKIDNCANSCIINVLVMGIMVLSQRNISYFKCRIFCKQKRLCEFREFLVISRSVTIFFSAFSIFFKKSYSRKFIENLFCSPNNRTDKLTYRNCFYSQRSVFCITMEFILKYYNSMVLLK